MKPTLEVGDFILVNKFAYGIRLPVLDTKVIPIGDPQRGDVMVFRYPSEPNINYIKRVVGLPGDTVRYTRKSACTSTASWWRRNWSARNRAPWAA